MVTNVICPISKTSHGGTAVTAQAAKMIWRPSGSRDLARRSRAYGSVMLPMTESLDVSCLARSLVHGRPAGAVAAARPRAARVRPLLEARVAGPRRARVRVVMVVVVVPLPHGDDLLVVVVLCLWLRVREAHLGGGFGVL